MKEKSTKGSSRPLIFGLLTLILSLAITQYLAYQRYIIIKKSDQQLLLRELDKSKERLKDILYNNISSANTIAILHKQHHNIGDFDSIAKQILTYNQSIDLIIFADKYTITHAYPLEGNQMILGHSMLDVPLFRKELEIALKNKEILFTGPYEMTNGRGTAIGGRIPIFENDTFKGLVNVVTKLSTIKKLMPQLDNKNKDFVYRLTKKNLLTGKTEYFFEGYIPTDDGTASAYMPEGNWTLHVAYSKSHPVSKEPISISILGLLFSISISSLVYYRVKQSTKLENLVESRTHLLAERIKELSTIYQVQEILKDDSQTEENVFTKIVETLPQGWQYPEVCKARIHFDGKDYTTKGYIQSAYKQVAAFELFDHRKGYVEIIYTKEKPPEAEGCFLNEERDMINTIADTIMIYFNKASQQRTLRESEAKFRGAFEDAAIGMALVSLEGKWIRVNKGLCEMIGYTKEELTALSFQQITHPDDLKRDAEFLKQTLEGIRDYYRVEKRYFHKNGSVIWINLNVALIRDGDGKPMYFVSQIENITERIESQMKFRNLVEQSLVGVYIVQDNKFVYVNPRIIEESGYSEAELSQLPIDEFIHPDDVQIVQDNIRARLYGEVDAIRYEIRAKRKNGEMLWMEMFGTVTMYNGAPAIIGTMVNITDKKNAYIEIEKSAANLKTIFNATEVSYLLLDKKLNIIAYNQHFQDNYKLQTNFDVAEGLHFPDITIPERRKVVTDQLKQVIDTQQPIEYEVAYTNQEKTRHLFVRLTPVVSNEVVIGVCLATINITNRKNLELERQKIINDLVQRNRDLEQFAHILSHNVRAPLSTILGLSSFVKEEQDEEERAITVEGIEHSAKQLDIVIKDLNEILHIKRDISELKTNVKFDEIVSEVKHMLATSIKDKQAVIEYDFRTLNEMSSVRSYMHSIFYNLISNAIKYSRPDIAPHIRIVSEKQDNKIRLVFTDNGTGIDMNKYGEQLFGLYKRFHHDVEGKGMGLFMVKTQVDSLKGAIEVQSKLGSGTTFTISFDE